MQQFKPVPRDLYKQAEPEAGEVLPALTGQRRARRPRDEFEPDWDYILSGGATITAVVAALNNGNAEVPDSAWERAFTLYCPKARSMLAASGSSFERWNSGRCPGGLTDAVAALANTELDGYAVFAVLDVAVAESEIIAALGAMPEFK